MPRGVHVKDPVAYLKAKLFELWCVENANATSEKLLTDWLAGYGLQRAGLDAWARGDKAIPEPLVRLFEQEMGVPPTIWPSRSLMSGGPLIESVQSRTVDANVEEPAPRGRPPTHAAKFYEHFRRHGYYAIQAWVDEVGAARGVSYAAMTSWIMGRYRVPEDEAIFLNRTIGLPLNLWNEAYQRYHKTRKPTPPRRKSAGRARK